MARHAHVKNMQGQMVGCWEKQLTMGPRQPCMFLTPKTQRLDRSWPRQLLWAVPAAINLKDKTSLPLGLLTARYQSVDSWRPAILCPATQAYCEHGAYVGLRRLPHGSLGEGKSGQTAGAGAFLYTVSELSLCRWPGGFCLLSTSMKQQQTNFLACI